MASSYRIPGGFQVPGSQTGRLTATAQDGLIFSSSESGVFDAEKWFTQIGFNRLQSKAISRWSVDPTI